MSPYKAQLTEIFSNANITEQQIDDAIKTILEANVTFTTDECLEQMILLLLESGNSTLATNTLQEGAIGYSSNRMENNIRFNEHFDRLLILFPDICPEYLVEFCHKYDPFDFEQIFEDLSKIDYLKVDKDPIDVWEHLKQMLPNADPIYLRNQARVLVNRPPGELQQFIEKAIDEHNYPTMQEYLKNKEVAADFALYITNFSVHEYLNKVPNPVETFTNPDRKPLWSSGDINKEDLEFALTFLYNQFLYQRKREIEKIFSHYDKNLVKACNKLKNLPRAFRNPRKLSNLNDCKNVDLLQEISFIKHEKLIRQFLKQKDEKYRLAFEEARLHGLLQTCACCFDDQLIPEECYFCNKGCIFCKECVKSGAEHVIGKEETTFPCLSDCDSEFDYSVLQMVLDVKTFQGVWHRKQIEEIRKANIDGLETCPFCDFCMVLDEGEKIFKCANIECMAETCRLCRHKSHIPKRCNEIEYDEDVKMRTFIENKMTEALLRKCWKCGKQFYKESGCNKMTCVCGARMCYVCGQAVTDYSHFNNERCPLYTDNLQEFHLNRVLQGAQSAKAELGIADNPNRLKFDPTRGIENDVA